MATIDIKTAAIILDRAFTEASPANDKTGMLIDKVLHGNHKTYRYILVTALLAKATNEEINPLSLQKGDGNNGKYDARTLCHKAIVPFETLKLPGCLGGSNEPFLNKPARFPMLSTSNAVRKGNDLLTLTNLISILSGIGDSATAYHYLKSALFTMREISKEYVSIFSIGDTLIDLSRLSQIVLDYIYAMAEHTLEGETCPLIVAQMEQMYLGKDYKVMPHKVNESGTSSKEVGDIDIYDKNGSHAYSIEVKDKDFSAQDVAHAISKFKQAGLTTSLFIYGKKASFDKESAYALLKKAGREGHYCCLISILHYSKLRISEIKSITVHDFVDGMLKFARLINAKEDTVSTVKQIASKIS